MKKVLIVVALVALAIVPVAAKGFGVGLEAGNPSGVTLAYDIDEKWDGYATIGFAFVGGGLDAVVGGQYEVANFEIGKAEFDVNVGLQAGVYTNFKSLGLAVRGTGAIDYDWTWKDVGDFTAYLRAAFGVGIGLTGDYAGAGFSWAGALGCVYYL